MDSISQSQLDSVIVDLPWYDIPHKEQGCNLKDESTGYGKLIKVDWPKLKTIHLQHATFEKGWHLDATKGASLLLALKKKLKLPMKISY